MNTISVHFSKIETQKGTRIAITYKGATKFVTFEDEISFKAIETTNLAIEKLLEQFDE